MNWHGRSQASSAATCYFTIPGETDIILHTGMNWIGSFSTWSVVAKVLEWWLRVNHFVWWEIDTKQWRYGKTTIQIVTSWKICMFSDRFVSKIFPYTWPKFSLLQLVSGIRTSNDDVSIHPFCFITISTRIGIYSAIHRPNHHQFRETMQAKVAMRCSWHANDSS